MPRIDADLLEGRAYIEELLLLIAKGSALPPGAMCLDLADSLPKMGPANLHRGWNRWLRCATDGSTPNVTTLFSIVDHAIDKQWIHPETTEMSPNARHLLETLQTHHKRNAHDEAIKKANRAIERRVERFLDQLFESGALAKVDLEEMAPALMGAFAVKLAGMVDARLKVGGISPIYIAIDAAARNALASHIDREEKWEADALSDHMASMEEEDRRVARTNRLSKRKSPSRTKPD